MIARGHIAEIRAYLASVTGSRATRTDGNGFTTIYRYDNNRRLSEIEYPDGKKVQYAFDERGNKIFEGHVDPGQNFAATTRTFTYDELNRLRSVTDSSLGKTIQYEFDENGNRTKIIDAEGGVTRWEYDRNNRPVKVTDPDGQVTRFEYDAAGRRTKAIYGNGVWTEYRYDASSQLTHMVTRDRTNLTLQGWHYQYDLRGNRTSKTDHAGNVEAYLYDGLGRLTQTTYPNGRIVKWTYDAVGNRLTQTNNGSLTTYSYNAANQIQEAVSYQLSAISSVTTFGFDGNGNMTQKNEPSGFTQYVWDFENRLREVISPSGTTTFGYDANGIRVFKESGGVGTDYLIDTASVLAEYENGVKKSAYTLGPRIDEIISAQLSALDSGPSTKYWYSSDALGSVTALTDAAGRVIKTYRYGAWGEEADVTGPDISNPYRWTGREWDAAGLQYNRARHYSNSLGRWISEDPIRTADVSLHKNKYIYSNPVASTDPSGMMGMYSFDEWPSLVTTCLKKIYKQEVAALEIITLYTESPRAPAFSFVGAIVTYQTYSDFFGIFWPYNPSNQSTNLDDYMNVVQMDRIVHETYHVVYQWTPWMVQGRATICIMGFLIAYLAKDLGIQTDTYSEYEGKVENDVKNTYLPMFKTCVREFARRH
jgi:RHS repeat-associated protein